MEITEQLRLIKRNVVEIINENELLERLKNKRVLRVKFGIDPTSPDIHLGHTVTLTKLRQLQELGHLIVFIIGDFTACIGDPTGRNETRPMLDIATVRQNAESYKEQMFKILRKDNIEIHYNSEWFNKLSINDFLRLTREYTVARLLEREDFNERYRKGNPITLLEFIYPLLQGYDSVMVQADVEIGGVDQKFNLLVGREIQRAYNQEPQIILTLPLLEGTDGVRKMSKSYNNYIGISEEPDQMYGKIMSISDTLMYKYYELLTPYDVNEIKKMHPRDAKAQLAYHLVAKYHSEEDAKNASIKFDTIFRENKLPDDIDEINTEIKEKKIVELLTLFKLADSKSEAKRLILQGGVKVNNEVVNDISKIVVIDKPTVIQVGKRKFVRLIPTS
jgi:tyrosyl-tRNA synthetase